MTADLPTVIREALHAHEIDASDLLRPQLRTRTSRGRSPKWLAPVAAAAVVLALAIGLAAIVSRHSSGSQDASASTGLAGVVGYRWRVTQIADALGSVSVPSTVHAEIGFTRTQVFGDDTVNALSADYRRTADGYSVGQASTTLVAYSGADPIRARTIRAVDELFYSVARSPGAAAPAVHVTVHLRGDKLTLQRKQVTVTAMRAGVQREGGTASRTPSASTISFFRYLGPVSHPVLIAGKSLLLEPPDGAKPRLTPAQAYRKWCRDTANCANRTTPADMVLARLTTPNSGPARPDGSLIRPGVLKVLSYVLTWHVTDCPLHGGRMTGATPAAQPRTTIPCTETDPIDANTGKAIAGRYYDG